MSRCDYDAVFYRVFCITLLTIAFIFTLILTNVFVDIDGLLSKRPVQSKIMLKNEADYENITPEPVIIDNTNSGEGDESYRTKRSIETQNILFHIKNPKIKNILTNRLESLLESLDAEDQENRSKERHIIRDETKDMRKDIETIVNNHNDEEGKLKRQRNEDLLHLTVHDILLREINGHVDLKEISKKVGSLMIKLNNAQKSTRVNEEIIEDENKPYLKKKSLNENYPNENVLELAQNIPEISKCNKLQEKIIDTVHNNDNIPINGERARSGSIILDKSIALKTPQSAQLVAAANINDKPNVWINTVIDIKSNDNKRNSTITKKNIHGVIELIYNGKSIKFSRPDGDIKQNLAIPLTIIEPKASKSLVSIETTSPISEINIHNLKNIPKGYLNKFVTEYFKHFPNGNENRNEMNSKISTKRLKRHVKIKFAQRETTPHIHQKEKIDTKKNDDELFVEIETHFDSKGLKGEKKKKLIKNLIDKIQKAIRSDESKKLLKTEDIDIEKRKIPKQLHVRKRLQNPLKPKKLEQKHTFPVSGIVHRQLNPITISKTLRSQEHVPYVRDKSGETWKKNYNGPAFLTAKKSINSAEMNELDVDYNRVLDVNGVPQRLQKPLNTDMSEETMNTNSIYDLGNMKFFIKDIDGSGFSIGYNQYVDEPPDVEAMKLFTGLENVIKTYHQNYDDTVLEENADPTLDVTDDGQQISHQNDHMIMRRSIEKEHNYQSNEYLRIYDDQYLPYNSYKDIYERQTNTELNVSKNVFKEEPPLIVNENIFNKNLKPAEILGLANMFERKKRSVRVKKISNIKNKIKLNRFLNTKAMATKRIFLNKKRNKRQINKIRIIASDFPRKDSSDENIYIVSDENLSANRATIREATSAIEPIKSELSEYLPYQTEETEYPTYKIFDGKFRHNLLMSKYPHIFKEEIMRSREELIPDNGMIFDKIPAISKAQNIEQKQDHTLLDTTITPQTLSDIKNTELTEKSQHVQDIVEALQTPKAKYKVTVKIVPKNLTNLNSGFKEIHTSINKSFNKNGLIYSSLVNVSEISKVAKINKKNSTKANPKSADEYLAKILKGQQEKMHLILRQQRKHIDEQLLRLSEEKSNIDSILVDDNNTIVPHFDYITAPSKMQKILHLSKDELDKLTAISSLDKNPSTTTIATTTAKIKTSILISKIQTTPPPQLLDNLKKDILRKMDKNDNLANEILKKIDKNTEIIQTFLKKLTDKIIDFNKLERRNCNEYIKTEKPVVKFDVNHLPIDWRSHHFNPNMSFRRNESHVQIPFVYAYQQPILPHKINTPLASIVYHGHIHTHSLHSKKDISTEKGTNHILSAVKSTHKIIDKEPHNQTRFFIDELESDYKVIPVLNVKKNLKNCTVT